MFQEKSKWSANDATRLRYSGKKRQGSAIGGKTPDSFINVTNAS
jgi:hypothetical protein